MEPELSRLSTIMQQDRRRLSLMSEQAARQSVIFQQPRGSVASRGVSPSSDSFTEMQRRRMSVKSLRRKSINPRLDPPPGLEGLNDKGFIYVRQQMESDLRGGCGATNTYKIWNEREEELFYVLEDASCICRWFCGPHRQFRLDFFTPQDDLVFTLYRKSCRCDWCCCLDCVLCNHKVYVVDCLNRTLGSIKQKFGVCQGNFEVMDNDGETIAKIFGPCCIFRCCTEISFEIWDKIGEEKLGSINKKWEGEQEDGINVDHEYFDINFPEKMNSIEKMLIIGGAFLIDYMYFEMS
ncbi:phospholipid scramblase 1-like [Saccostrea cucullata]|uniref:phospholipid scramblase 1-like n=1 Tax=Saccostrea cuccullata TaxID=36930 RepID=UPI002ED4AC02